MLFLLHVNDVESSASGRLLLFADNIENCIPAYLSLHFVPTTITLSSKCKFLVNKNVKYLRKF